jgi:allantoinase
LQDKRTSGYLYPQFLVAVGAKLGLHAYLSRRIVTPSGMRAGAVVVEGEQIRDIVALDRIPVGALRDDFGEAALLPGLVDSHVHINEPGRTDWGGFRTVTQAAAAGGYTMLVDMPLNCIPATTDVAALQAKRQSARGKCWVDWGAWGGVVQGNNCEIESLAGAGVFGFKCFLDHSGVDEFRMLTESDLRTALPHVARTGLPLLVHAEVPGPIIEATERLCNADWRKYATYLSSRPDQAELQAIQLMLSLCREFGFHLHVVHLATANAIDMLRAARAEGLPVTVETCPHYLHFEAEKIADGATQCKCAPPIRGQENREKLWQALREGVIDMIVTDHSPCPPTMKKLEEGNFQTAWGGIASLSMALPVVWTEARQRGFSLNDIARWMAEKPAELAGCGGREGRIAPGYDADFVVFDPEAEFTCTEDRLHQGPAISPYVGERLRGVVKKTYLRGEQVFAEGQFPANPPGCELPKAKSNPDSHGGRLLASGPMPLRVAAISGESREG